MNGNGTPTERVSLQSALPRCVQFGVFELRLDTAELLKHGMKVKLQGKPFQILQALLERPGSVVTREDLHARIWGADSSVDFESSLNTAANRLRLTLGDSAENPRYIETLPRVGYRFIAPLRENGADTPAVENEPAPVTVLLPEPMPMAEPRPAVAAALPRTRLWAWAVAAVALVSALAMLLFWARARPSPALHQVTFRRGAVLSARFGPDGESVLYAARWSGGPPKLYTTNLVSPESRDLGFPGAVLSAVSPKGELALLSTEPTAPQSGATLLRVRENGGAPLALANGVVAADWYPESDNLAVIRVQDQGWVLEFPRGKVLYRSPGWMTHVRVSPSGDRVALIEHAVFGDDGGAVRIVERNGATRILSAGWSSAWGLAWSPSGNEVWFTAAHTGLNRFLHAVTPAGKVREVASTPGMMTLEDVSRTGRVLISHGEERMMMVSSGADGAERDLSWFDLTRAEDVSADGSLILFDETGEGGGPGYSVYLHRTKTGSVVRLGEGRAVALSPDGKYVMTGGQSDQGSVKVLSLDLGQPRTITSDAMKYIWAKFFPDNKRILFGGSQRGGRPKLFTQSIDGSDLRVLQPEIWLTKVAISPDGAKIAGVHPTKNLVVLDAQGGPPVEIPLGFPSTPLRWSEDGRYLYVATTEIPARILRIDVTANSYLVWKTVAPSDPAGVNQIFTMLLTGDAQTAIYSYERKLSEVYVVDGWR
jgi:DNA-binding winged helix-turn-helix (wHTH) protein/WD40 repeat protein